MVSGDGFSSSSPSHTSFINVPIINPNPNSSNSAKRKRNLAGNPDPDAEVIALSPNSLVATNRFVCEICSKGFQRDQNLQLHRRGHNLPWKLKQRNKQEVVRKKVYICPEISCVHHDPSRALGDLTGVKKHFSRKHGEKKWKCEKCLKKYAVQSDWKAHSKICGMKEYKCDCGTIFSRKDSFITHRAFCDAIMEDNNNSRMASFAIANTTNLINGGTIMSTGMKPVIPIWLHNRENNPIENTTSSSVLGLSSLMNNNINGGISSSEMAQWLSRSEETNPLYNYGGCSNPLPSPPHMSATALLQKASQIASTRSTNCSGFGLMNKSEFSGFNSLTRPENSMMVNGDGLMMMMMAEMTRTTTREVDSGEGNLTRNFLGVEGLQQEIIKFSCSMNDSSI